MESICSEITSFELSDTDLEQAMDEIGNCQQILESGGAHDLFHPITEFDCNHLKNQVQRLLRRIRSEIQGKEKDGVVKDGHFLYSMFSRVEITHENAYQTMAKIESMIQLLFSGNLI